ncbi:MAG TPA: hypothetical protein VG797_10475 [Phycisphaerales bacterium]|nr:hypothetical protein [Phycisphaerales bacterium]
MSQAQQTPLDPAERPPQVSLGAMVAMFLSLTSVLGCGVIAALFFLLGPASAVGMLVTPALGLAGVTLGGLSLYRIRKAAVQGVLVRGQGMALIGIFVGLMSAVVQGAAAGGALVVWRNAREMMTPSAGRLVMASVQGDIPVARLELMQSSTISDERLRSFGEMFKNHVGEPRRADLRLSVFVRASRELRSAPGAATAQITQDKIAPFPVEIEADRGTPLCYIFLDTDALQRQQQVRIADVLVLLPGHECITLATDGPARTTGDALGYRVVEK